VSADAVGDSCTSLIDALVLSVRCQQPRNAVATLDSALNGGHIRPDELDADFARLPPRFQTLRGLVDGRAQSGPETLVRLLARSLGCRVELQVHFSGVGYVDLLVDGWLVIECDSRAFHGDWAAHAKDRRRDAVLAALGYHTLRLAAAMILSEPEAVVAAIRGLRAARAALVDAASR
jgi:very-short-patch-repair endonuclease